MVMDTRVPEEISSDPTKADAFAKEIETAVKDLCHERLSQIEVVLHNVVEIIDKRLRAEAVRGAVIDVSLCNVSQHKAADAAQCVLQILSRMVAHLAVHGDPLSSTRRAANVFTRTAIVALVVCEPPVDVLSLRNSHFAC